MFTLKNFTFDDVPTYQKQKKWYDLKARTQEFSQGDPSVIYEQQPAISTVARSIQGGKEGGPGLPFHFQIYEVF